MKNDWRLELASALAQTAGVEMEVALRSLTPPGAPVCDWCSTLAFALAKEKKENPAKLAAGWAAAMNTNLPAILKSVEARGPYLNFHFSPAFWSRQMEQVAEVPGFGHGPARAGKVLIEFPSVNPNKPWHVGHLRNALLGDSLARVLSYAGHSVEREDYIDDLGLQVAQSVWGQHHLPAPTPPAGSEAFSKKLDHVLGWQYVEVAKKVSDPVIEAEVRKLLHTLEAGGSKESAHARKIVEDCVRAQYETAFAFGIRHDVLIFESDVVRTIFVEGMERIRSSGAVGMETTGKNAGCLVVKLQGERGFEGMENADKILIRSDGTATYTGKDVVFQLWKFGLLNAAFAYSPFVKQPDGTTAEMSNEHGAQKPYGHARTVINVIGMEQAYPQKVISAMLRKMGCENEAVASIHLAYEHVVLPEGRFSGRAGTWMAGHARTAGADGGKGEAGGSLDAPAKSGPGFTADELLAEVERGASEKIRGEHDEKTRAAISRAVAVGAIRYAFLRVSAGQKIVFDYEKALSLQGDSGPYIMYAYARACSILRKAHEAGLKPKAPGADYSFGESEMRLGRLMLTWPGLVSSCAEKFEVHPLAVFAIDAAGAFNQFYTTTPVLAEDVPSASKSARLMEVAGAREMMGAVMDMLGIPRLEQM